MSETISHIKGALSQKTQELSDLGDRLLRWYRDQPIWKKCLIFTGLGIATIAGLLALIFHKQIIKLLVTISDTLHHSVVGGVILFTLVFFVGFPPLLGFLALLMLCGMVYGFPLGWLLLAPASVLGSFASFLVFRHLLKDQAANLVRKNEKFKAFSEILQEDNSLFLLILIRLCPLPYSLLNGALASIPNLSATTYLWASIITSPKMFVHIFVGHAIKNLGDEERPASAKWLDLFSIVLTGIALFIASYIIYNRMEQKLQSFHNGLDSYEEMVFDTDLNSPVNFELNSADYDEDNFIIGYDDEGELPERALIKQDTTTGSGKISI